MKLVEKHCSSASGAKPRQSRQKVLHDDRLHDVVVARVVKFEPLIEVVDIILEQIKITTSFINNEVKVDRDKHLCFFFDPNLNDFGMLRHDAPPIE